MTREGWVERPRRWAAGAGGVALAAAGLALAWGWYFGRGLALAGACWLFGAAVACGAWRRGPAPGRAGRRAGRPGGRGRAGGGPGGRGQRLLAAVRRAAGKYPSASGARRNPRE